MFRNKLVNVMIFILLIISLMGVVALVTVNVYYADGKKDGESIDEILKHSSDIEEITTNLQTGGFLRVQFKVQTDSKKAKEELEKRDFQVRNIIIYEISNKKSSDFAGNEGLKKLESDIQAKLNEVMKEGSVIQVYTTSFLLQK